MEVARCLPVGLPTGSYPETGFEEVNGDLREADFWTTSSESALDATFGLPVIRTVNKNGLSMAHP